MMIALLGLGLLLMMSQKKKGESSPAESSSQPPVEIEVPVAPTRGGDTPASATPAQATSQADDPADAAPTAAPPPIRVDIGPAINIRPTAPKPGGSKLFDVQPKPGLDVAKKSAQSTADHVRTNGSRYDRARIATWQAAAGLPPDGLYGPATANALKKFGAKNVPGPQFAGAGSKKKGKR